MKNKKFGWIWITIPCFSLFLLRLLLFLFSSSSFHNLSLSKKESQNPLLLLHFLCTPFDGHFFFFFFLILHCPPPTGTQHQLKKPTSENPSPTSSNKKPTPIKRTQHHQLKLKLKKSDFVIFFQWTNTKICCFGDCGETEIGGRVASRLWQLKLLRLLAWRVCEVNRVLSSSSSCS